MKTRIYDMYQQAPRYTLIKNLAFLFFILLIYLGYTVFRFDGINPIGILIVRNMFFGLFRPDVSLLMDVNSAVGVPYLMLETVSMAFLGTLVGAVLAIPLAVLSAKNISSRFVSMILTLLISFMRAFPTFVIGLMIIRVSGPGPFTGVLTLAIYSSSMLAKQFVDYIEDIDKGIIEALDAMGLNTFHKLRFGLIPHLLGALISVALYRFEINVRNSIILGMIGAGGIGNALIVAINGYHWDVVGALLIGLIVIILLVEVVSNRLRRVLS
jgi:phosphonate transport system permease protein